MPIQQSTEKIIEQYQANLGRQPTGAEIDFFKGLLDKNEMSAYELGAFLQGHPERQENRLNQYGQQYEQKLAASDADILSKAGGVAASQFARMGRPGSSGIGSQIAQAGQNLAMNRQNALSQFYGQGYGNQMGAFQDNSQNAISRAYGLGDQRRQYAQDLSMYNLQKNDYNDYLNQANRRAKAGAWGSLAGGLVGSYFGPPENKLMGAMAGSKIGGQAGGLF